MKQILRNLVKNVIFKVLIILIESSIFIEIILVFICAFGTISCVV